MGRTERGYQTGGSNSAVFFVSGACRLCCPNTGASWLVALRCALCILDQLPQVRGRQQAAVSSGMGTKGRLLGGAMCAD